jgi:predicted acyltransferase
MKEAPAGRLRSLDLFRGATIAGMILVNNPGDRANAWAPLEHAAWHGWTPTDLVFPFFLFAVGVAIPLAFARRLEAAAGNRGPLYRQIVRRTAILLALGRWGCCRPTGWPSSWCRCRATEPAT